jgi:hypothetical protein
VQTIFDAEAHIQLLPAPNDIAIPFMLSRRISVVAMLLWCVVVVFMTSWWVLVVIMTSSWMLLSITERAIRNMRSNVLARKTRAGLWLPVLIILPRI